MYPSVQKRMRNTARPAAIRNRKPLYLDEKSCTLPCAKVA
jgi:hypothetical protein